MRLSLNSRVIVKLTDAGRTFVGNHYRDLYALAGMDANQSDVFVRDSLGLWERPVMLWEFMSMFAPVMKMGMSKEFLWEGGSAIEVIDTDG